MENAWNRKQLFKMLGSKEERKDLRSIISRDVNFLGLADSKSLSKRNTLNENGLTFRQTPEIRSYVDAFLANGYEEKETSEEEIKSFTPEDALALAHDYYKTTGKVTFDTFSSLFAQRDNNIKFIQSNRLYNSDTIYCPSNNEVYMYVNFDGTIYGLTNLVHEFAHGISYKTIPIELRTGAENNFMEVESYFHTLAFLDFLEGIGFEKDISTERQNILNSVIADTKLITSAHDLNKIYVETNGAAISMLRFRRFLEEKHGITSEEFNRILKAPVSEIIPYIIGPYIAFELYHIYEKDPEYALFLYQAIIRIQASSVHNFFEQIHNISIEPGKNINTFVRKIKAPTL